MEICQSWRFWKGWVTFSTHFRGKGASPTNYWWCQKTRLIALSCSIKISAVHNLILSQYTHLIDRQNCNSNTVRRITCSRTVKSKWPPWTEAALHTVLKFEFDQRVPCTTVEPRCWHNSATDDRWCHMHRIGLGWVYSLGESVSSTLYLIHVAVFVCVCSCCCFFCWYR